MNYLNMSKSELWTIIKTLDDNNGLKWTDAKATMICYLNTVNYVINNYTKNSVKQNNTVETVTNLDDINLGDMFLDVLGIDSNVETIAEVPTVNGFDRHKLKVLTHDNPKLDKIVEDYKPNITLSANNKPSVKQIRNIELYSNNKLIDRGSDLYNQSIDYLEMFCSQEKLSSLLDTAKVIKFTMANEYQLIPVKDSEKYRSQTVKSEIKRNNYANRNKTLMAVSYQNESKYENALSPSQLRIDSKAVIQGLFWKHPVINESNNQVEYLENSTGYNLEGLLNLFINGKQIYPVPKLATRKISESVRLSNPKSEKIQSELLGNVSPIFQIVNSNHYYKAEILTSGKVNLLYCTSAKYKHDLSQWYLQTTLGCIDSKDVSRYRWISNTIEQVTTARRDKIADVCKWLNTNQVNLTSDKLLARFPMLINLAVSDNAISCQMYGNKVFISKVKQSDKTLIILQKSLEVANSNDSVINECYLKVSQWLSSVNSLTLGDRTNKSYLVESKHGQKSVNIKDNLKFARKMLVRFSEGIEVNNVLMGKLTLLDGTSIPSSTLDAIATKFITDFPVINGKSPTDYLIIKKFKSFDIWAKQFVKVVNYVTGSEIAITTPTNTYKFNDANNAIQQWLMKVSPVLLRYGFYVSVHTLGAVLNKVIDYNVHSTFKLPTIELDSQNKNILASIYK